MTKLIIGCGTGRCGTKTLAKILECHKDIMSYHEIFCRYNSATFHDKYGMKKWRYDNSDFYLIKDFLSSKLNKPFVHSDVGPYYVNFLKEIETEFYEDVKIIILKRNKEDFVRSFVNNILCYDETFFKKKNNYGKSFVKFSNDLIKDAHIYYEEFYKKIESQNLKRAIFLNTEGLNSKDKIIELFDFLEIEPVFEKFFHENKKSSSIEELY